MFTAGNCYSKQKCSRPLKTGKVKLVCSWPVTAIQNRKSKTNMFMAGNCHSKDKKRNLRLLAGDSSLLFFWEWQFPAMNISILLFLFWTAVLGYEHTNFTFSVLNSSCRLWAYQFYFFCFEWQFPVVNILILPLLLFHFYFYFHFIIKMFCFVLKINKKESISSSMEKKIMLRFTFISISIQNS